LLIKFKQTLYLLSELYLYINNIQGPLVNPDKILWPKIDSG
jgi:hypothetical protein